MPWDILEQAFKKSIFGILKGMCHNHIMYFCAHIFSIKQFVNLKISSISVSLYLSLSYSFFFFFCPASSSFLTLFSLLLLLSSLFPPPPPPTPPLPSPSPSLTPPPLSSPPLACPHCPNSPRKKSCYHSHFLRFCFSF